MPQQQQQQQRPVSSIDPTVKRRRKKASRACSHCQKAHLTCDDSRPCQRCVKRGLEDTCTDGARKKAKYLREDENDSDQRFQSNVMTPPNMMNYMEDSNHHHVGFGSDTAGLEYGMLSKMIPLVDTNSPFSMTPINNTTPPTATTTTITSNNANHWTQQQQDIVLNNASSANTSPSISSLTPQLQHHPLNNNSNNHDPQQVLRRRKGIGSTPEEIYARVQRPYNYAESYHFLIEYVKHRMGRDQLIRISRALVLFRPSYMSLVAALTEEDLIYMEKCVQRTLLEFEKLISFSGTPTVVWRRTGEIVLVGKEFLLLTQWSKETLLGKRTYIYELMDNGSAVEYWEKFSQHAFDNAELGVYMSVILMSPSYRPVPCSFCFTLKRDIFDLPCVIVGNFLPILGANSGR
ncbi:uncharacterized protein ATC70_008261 [Mucor velutinosus]|uniref:Zn(2)-C6 fungal-type domain-containing protein n=1 Tax=Mucor velutinosus TaxID=708070 RepID=A0AAN7I3R4_9FUNG|nr:hypothetical protein ATC70_008261 [Mucor velutinosus]